MAGIPIPNLLKLPQLWRYVGFMSSVIGILCYALSSSFKHLFGEWNLLKIFLYGVGSFSICTFMLFAKKWKLSNGFMLKAHVAFLVLMVTSVYSFFYDKAVQGKTDVLGLISCGAFAFMSFSLSRQMDLGFEVDLLNFFLGCLTVQLMKINLMLASIGVVFCYFLILLRSSLDSQAQHHEAAQADADAENVLGNASESDQVSNNGFISGDTNTNIQRELPSLPPLSRRLDEHHEVAQADAENVLGNASGFGGVSNNRFMYGGTNSIQRAIIPASLRRSMSDVPRSQMLFRRKPEGYISRRGD